MQIRKAFYKNTKNLFPTLLIYLGVCITLLILTSKNGVSQSSTEFESTKLNIVVQDEDQSQLSKGLVTYLSQKHHIQNNQYTQTELADGLFYDKFDYALTIPTGFETNLIKGTGTHCLQNQKKNDSASGYFVDTQINQYLSLLDGYLTAGYSPEDATACAQDAASRDASVTVMQQDPAAQSNTIHTAFQYIPYSLLCMMVVGLGTILVTFRRKELHTRICCSPLPVMKRNMQLLICSVLFALVCWLSQIIAGVLLLSLNLFTTQGALYIVNSLVFLLVCISITFLVSFFVRTDYMMNLAANVIALGLCFLGGIYVPLEYMSNAVVRAAHLLPSYWYIIGMEQIKKYGEHTASLSSAFGCMGIQLLFAAVILCIALVASKRKKIS